VNHSGEGSSHIGARGRAADSGGRSNGGRARQATDVAVAVALSGPRHRVSSVILRADRQPATPAAGALGAAVLEAVQRATIEALTQTMQAGPGGPIGPGVQAGPRVPVPEEVPAADVEEVRRRLRSFGPREQARVLDTVEEAFRLLSERRSALLGGGAGDPAPAFAPPRVVGHSENRRVAVTLLGGHPVEVDVDDAWAARAGRQATSDALRQAFTAAYAAADEREESEAARGGGDPLLRVATELQSMLEGLGLGLGGASSLGSGATGSGRAWSR
jgi:DNA-binding protein YbaB